MSIAERYRDLRAAIPPEVTLVLAAKTRTPDEVAEAIEAGATDIGHNYVQEAAAMREALGELARKVRWHLIGHLQSNKIGKALPLFDMIQTIDGAKRARALDRRAERDGRSRVPVLVEVNIGDEEAKAGVRERDGAALETAVLDLVGELARLAHVRVAGLMTMGPLFGDPEDARPYFRLARAIFERLRAEPIPGLAEMSVLSMGMTDSWRVAIEEGSTMVRLGTAVFGSATAG